MRRTLSSSVSPPLPLRLRDLSNLDFIRSVAVLLVVMAHVTLYTGHFPSAIGWLGHAGVYIFFVHTSLVLMWSMERDPDTGRFYLRRIFRIFPLWLVVLAAYLLLRIPASPVLAPAFGVYHPSAGEVLANIFLLFDLRYGPNIVGASWSLPLEVQMYVVLPFLFFFIRTTKQIWPILVLDAMAMAFGAANLDAGYTLMLRSVPCFLPGVIAYRLFATTRPRLPGWIFPPFFLSYGLLMCRFASQRNGWILCLGLGLVLPLFRQIEWGWLNRTTHVIAKYSYGIYLTHILAIAVAVYVLRAHGMAVRVGSFFALFLGLPVLLYHTVEERMIRLGSRLAHGHAERKLASGRGSTSPSLASESDLSPAP